MADDDPLPTTEETTMSDETPELGTFEGRPILSTAIELPSLAGGLREAVDVAGGQPLHRDEERYLLLKVTGARTRFDLVKNTQGFQRVDIPTVESIALVEGSAVETMMADHLRALEARRAEEQRRKDEETGTQRIPGTAPYPEDADSEGDTIDSNGDPADPDAEPWPDEVPGPTDDPEQA